jgi:hypothetical protein
MNTRDALHVLRWSYCAFIIAASAVTMRSAMQGHGEGSHGAPFLVALAGSEINAAVALLLKPFELFGCAVLLIVYIVATVVSLLSGDWLALLRFIYYGVTAIYIVSASRNLASSFSQNQSVKPR